MERKSSVGSSKTANRDGMDQYSVGVATGEFLRGLVWGAGDRPMAGAAGLSFFRRPCGDLVKNLEIFLRWRSMIL